MLENLKHILQKVRGSGSLPSTTDRENDLRLATCALMIETAMADNNLSTEEFDKIFQVIRERYNLDSNAVQALIEAAIKEQQEATDVWSFANQINETLTREEKIEVMEMLWKIVYADGKMDKFEDYVTKKFHRLLRIDHPTFIATKLKVKNSLEDST